MKKSNHILSKKLVMYERKNLIQMEMIKSNIKSEIIVILLVNIGILLIMFVI